MIRFILKLILVTVIRFVMIFTLAFFAESFDVSPLPMWTLAIFVYAALFVITYGAARWIFQGQQVSKGKIIAAFVFLIIGESILEAWVQLFFTRWDWTIVLNSLTWSKLIPLAVNVGALAYAIMRKKMKALPHSSEVVQSSSDQPRPEQE